MASEIMENAIHCYELLSGRNNATLDILLPVPKLVIYWQYIGTKYTL